MSFDALFTADPVPFILRCTPNTLGNQLLIILPTPSFLTKDGACAF
jgi:hypothetical protein